MVQFNEVYINPNGREFSLDIEIPNKPYLQNVYIGSVILTSAYVDHSPNTESIEDREIILYNLDIPEKRPLVYKEGEEDNNIKSLSLQIHTGDQYEYSTGPETKETGVVGKFDGVVYVYVIPRGTPSIECPCGEDTTYDVRCVVNTKSVYNPAMQYVRNFSNSCYISNNFIDYILKAKALEISIATGNYEEVDNLFKELNSPPSQTPKGCGCGNK